MKFENFNMFIAEKNNNVNILFYDIKIDLSVKILYNELIYYTNITDEYKLISTEIKFEKLNINNLNIIVNDNDIEFNKDIIKYCKIIEN